MFGYVKAKKDEMKIREYETYRAAYCGLCRSMGKCTGCFSKFTLSYDFVFLFLLRSVLEKETITVSSHRCIAHPLKKRPMVDISESSRYCARASVALTYFKLKDDVADSRGAKKLLSLLSMPSFKRNYKKYSSKELGEKIEQRLSELSELERSACPSVDAPAEIFGKLLGDVFCFGLEGSRKTLAREIGFHTGKFIYAADAADDYKKDLDSGSYNPFCLIYKDGMTEDTVSSIKTALLCELDGLSKAIELVDFSEYRDIEGIVKNIIYLGMPEVITTALQKASDKNPQQKA